MGTNIGSVKTVLQAAAPDAPRIPVVIVGAGACGLTAALALHRLGVECVVAERDDFARGSTALSSGFVPAPGTLAQRALGVQDSPAQFAADIQAKSHGRAAPHLVQAYTHAIGPALDALQIHHGITWQVLDGFLYPGHSALRMHAVPERTGSALMSRLLAAVDRAGVPVLTHARAQELWVDADQRVHAVVLERPHGNTEVLHCEVLLLACNGFGGAQDLVQELIPEMAAATYAGHAGNDGSAIRWGRALGAQLADLTGYQGHGSWAIPQGALVTWALMVEGGVQINAHGQRFHDETQGYSEAATQVLAQPQGLAWNVFDAPLLALGRTFPDFVEAEKAGAVQCCPTIHSLAQLMGCDPAVLEQTLASLQPGSPASARPDGRALQRALQAPYYAIKVTGALFHTQGGLAIDDQTRVLRTNGQPLPNLLAAGGAAQGVSGDAVWGYLSGNGLLSAIAGGHIAAHTAQWLLQP